MYFLKFDSCFFESFVISIKDLIKNKKLTNRLKDQADIEELAKRKKGRGKD